MKPLDRVLQRWRIGKAAAFVPQGARILDVGCADGALFHALGLRIAGGVGIDPAATTSTLGSVRFVRGRFPEDYTTDERFDVITMLAVFEHLDDGTQLKAAEACARLLREGGRLVLTIPHPAVDRIVHLLIRLGLVAGMALDEHHGFDVDQTAEQFERTGFILERRERFQFHLNNLFVFRRK